MKSSLQSLSVFIFLAVNFAASSAEPKKTESINDRPGPRLIPKKLKQTKPFQHKNFIIGCLVESVEGRRTLVVRISRSGEELPALQHKDVKVVAKDLNGKPIEMRGKDPEAFVGEMGNSLGRTAFLYFSLNDSDDPVDVEVGYGGERPTFRLEGVK
jgi:hypothetical protein